MRRWASATPGVIVRWLATDGRVLHEHRVGIQRHVPLTIRLPPGAQLVILEGTDNPRSRAVRGPDGRFVITPPDRVRWWRRR